METTPTPQQITEAIKKVDTLQIEQERISIRNNGACRSTTQLCYRMDRLEKKVGEIIDRQQSLATQQQAILKQLERITTAHFSLSTGLLAIEGKLQTRGILPQEMSG